jgi:hypothetical protein
MLFEKGRIRDIENYINNSNEDTKLIKWWAKYCESIGDYTKAKAAYSRAGDHLSLVCIYPSSALYCTPINLFVHYALQSTRLCSMFLSHCNCKCS